MRKLISVKYIILFVSFLIIVSSSIYAVETPQLNISFDERIQQDVTYHPLTHPHSDYNLSWINNYENQSYYNITGSIVFENINEETTNATLIDVWIELNNLDDILWLDRITDTRNATIYGLDEEGNINRSMNSSTFFDNVEKDLTEFIIHIPELNPNENVTFDYSVDPVKTRPPINFTTQYDRSKIIAGDIIKITDYVENVFDPNEYQRDCIYDINIVQTTYREMLADTWYNYTFYENDTNQLRGDDYSNAEISNDNYTLEWNVFDGDCLNSEEITNITYELLSPETTPGTDDYNIIDVNVSYKLDSTVSNANVVDVVARTEGVDFNVDKRIDDVAREDVTQDRNVTWEVISNISTGLEGISYNVTEVSLWVSERGGQGEMGDFETNMENIDEDTISGAPLFAEYTSDGMFRWLDEENNITYTDCSIDDILYQGNDLTNQDCIWNFNYTELPTPIVWNSFDFLLNINDYHLYNDTGDSDVAQIQSHSLTKDLHDYYLKQMYVIVDYWLDLEKDITSLGNDTYEIEIWVHNQGNRWTPINAPVSIFDFVPDDFEILTNLTDYDNESIYSDIHTDTYYTLHENSSIESEGGFNGELLKWTLMDDNDMNSSLAPGHDGGSSNWDDFNSTWYTRYRVRGDEEYNIDELYIVGLDPELVEGAASDLLIKIESGIYSLRNEELTFVIAFLFSLSIMFVVVFKN